MKSKIFFITCWNMKCEARHVGRLPRHNNNADSQLQAHEHQPETRVPRGHLGHNAERDGEDREHDGAVRGHAGGQRRRVDNPTQVQHLPHVLPPRIGLH